jgi:hypothetical protein
VKPKEIDRVRNRLQDRREGTSVRQATGAPEGGRAPRPTSTSPLITPPVDRAHGAATPAKRPLLPRERKGGDNAAVTKGMSRPATIPEPDQTWHPIARMLWDATLESEQTDFYESSDYAFLFSVCEDLSYYKRGIKRSDRCLSPSISPLNAFW